MATSQRKKQESGFFGIGQRYWSVMLVGEHGRVIPFRRFKELAVAVLATAVISSILLVVLGILYYHQGRSVQRLQSELLQLQQHAGKLKDEKDVLKAQLVINSMQTGTEPSQAAKTAAVSAPVVAQNTTPAKPAAEPNPQPETEPAKPVQPVVRWKADIRMFEADYDAGKELLKAKCRVYNMSSPKKPLSGRMVMVFKSKDDATVKWTAVPEVTYDDGKPSGQRGLDFEVRNYRTMTFEADNQKRPLLFDTATVYVFLTDGTQLLSRDFKLDIPNAASAPVPSPAVEAQSPSSPSTVSAPEPPSLPLQPQESLQTDDNGQPEESRPSVDAPVTSAEDLPPVPLENENNPPQPEGEQQ